MIQSNASNEVNPTSNIELEPTSSAMKRPHPGAKGGFKTKQRRFNSKTTTGQPSYQSTPLPSTIVVQPIQTFFSVHTGSKNLIKFVDLIYQVIVSRDHKMSRNLTPEHLEYVSLLSFHYRLVQVGLKAGYSFPTFSISNLKMAAESLLLPDPICKFIECIGVTRLPNGMTIVPYVPTDKEVHEHEDFVHPFSIEEMRLKFPDVEVDGELVPAEPTSEYYDGAINDDMIVDYNARTTRGFKSNVLFRRILFDNIEGRVEFSIARESNGRDCNARSVFQMEDALAHLGATYGFREIETRSNWLGDDNEYLSYVHASTPFKPDIFIVHKVANDLLNTK